MKKLFLCVIVVNLTGCLAMRPAKEPESEYEKADMQITSAGFVGCEPKSIKISEIVTIGHLHYPRAWKATCKDTTFICSEAKSDNTNQLSCKSELK